MSSPIKVFSVPDDPTVSPHYLCTVCNHREVWGTRDDAGCAATWHVYEEHRDVWIEMFGDRPPNDRDPRLDSVAVAMRPFSDGEVVSTTHGLAERTDEARARWAAQAKSLGEDVHYASLFATMGPESPQHGETIPWALCDRADDVLPDPGKFVASGSLVDVVSCKHCLAILAEQQVLYAVVIGITPDVVTGILCYVQHGEDKSRLHDLWGHMSSSEGWLKQDLTVNFGRLSQLEERFPQGYRVIHVGPDDSVPEEIQQWFGDGSLRQLQADLRRAEDETPPQEDSDE